MGTLNDALKALAGEQELISTSELAKKAGSTEDTLRKQMSTLKSKGLADGNSKDGWVITQEGRETLERQEKIPVTAKDVGADSESKLRYYGQLAGVTPDVILATIELILSGDPEDLDNVWTCMTQMDVPIASRRRWWNLWRNYLKQGIPPAMREKVVGPVEAAGEEEGEAAPTPAKGSGRDYIIVEDLPVNVGPGLGDYTLKDAKDLLQIRALRSRFSGTGGGHGGQGITLEDVLTVIDRMKEGRGDGAAGKIYAVEENEQGAILREVTPNTPLTLGRGAGNKPPTMYVVDADGTLQEMKPGIRVAPKPAAGNPPPQRITVVRQTDSGIQKESYEAGDVVVLENRGKESGGSGMLPFPVFDNSGQPVVDGQGRQVYANLEPTLRWLTFQNEQRRSDERTGMLKDLVKTVRENIPDGIQALKAAAEEARKERGGAAAAPEQPKSFTCTQCNTPFGIPNVPFERVACPKCRHEYTKAEVEAA